MFLSILSLVYTLLFQGGTFNLGQSKPVLPGKKYGNTTASKRTESACTWKGGAGPAPEVRGVHKGMARSHKGRMPSEAWPKCLSKPRGVVLFQLGAGTKHGARSRCNYRELQRGQPHHLGPGSRLRSGLPPPPQPPGSRAEPHSCRMLCHSHAITAGICCPQMNFNV